MSSDNIERRGSLVKKGSVELKSRPIGSLTKKGSVELKSRNGTVSETEMEAMQSARYEADSTMEASEVDGGATTTAGGDESDSDDVFSAYRKKQKRDEDKRRAAEWTIKRKQSYIFVFGVLLCRNTSHSPVMWCCGVVHL
jgi:hypothetical protein